MTTGVPCKSELVKPKRDTCGRWCCCIYTFLVIYIFTILLLFITNASVLAALCFCQYGQHNDRLNRCPAPYSTRMTIADLLSFLFSSQAPLPTVYTAHSGDTLQSSKMQSPPSHPNSMPLYFYEDFIHHHFSCLASRNKSDATLQ